MDRELCIADKYDTETKEFMTEVERLKGKLNRHTEAMKERVYELKVQCWIREKEVEIEEEKIRQDMLDVLEEIQKRKHDKEMEKLRQVKAYLDGIKMERMSGREGICKDGEKCAHVEGGSEREFGAFKGDEPCWSDERSEVEGEWIEERVIVLEGRDGVLEERERMSWESCGRSWVGGGGRAMITERDSIDNKGKMAVEEISRATEQCDRSSGCFGFVRKMFRRCGRKKGLKLLST